ncbi:hypothetical protein ASC90_20705 [Rhizobium sp. Root1220]|nr:hypothetical protein ASC90_20705 [Rhizobium sp. Root1220]
MLKFKPRGSQLSGLFISKTPLGFELSFGHFGCSLPSLTALLLREAGSPFVVHFAILHHPYKDMTIASGRI